MGFGNSGHNEMEYDGDGKENEFLGFLNEKEDITLTHINISTLLSP